MVKIRLKRVGAKKQPHYRIVVMTCRSPRDTESIERLGVVDPRANPPHYEVKEDRAIEWLNRGAQPTDVVRNIFRKTGVYQKWLAQKAAETAAETTAAPTTSSSS